MSSMSSDRPCRVLITSGGTSSPIDDVRKITNISTGRFGASLAEAALGIGAEVTYLHAPGALVPFEREARLELGATDSEAELARLADVQRRWRAVRERLSVVPLRVGSVVDYSETLRRCLIERPVDVVFLAMAVSDYAPEPQPGKIDSDPETLTIVCRRQPKVIRSVRDWAPGVYLVGFKLLAGVSESDLIAEADRACRTNRADLTIANDMTTVREGRHTVHLVRPGSPPERFGPGPEMPAQVVRRVLEFLAGRGKNGCLPPTSA